MPLHFRDSPLVAMVASPTYEQWLNLRYILRLGGKNEAAEARLAMALAAQTAERAGLSAWRVVEAVSSGEEQR